jgi:ribosome-associated toxin RatA of RatAB toxin-antitoxin module
MKRIARSAIVECSAEDFYDLVLAIESYPEFLPWCAAAEFHERTPGRSVATLGFSVKGLRYPLTTENSHVRGRSIDMRLVEGPFKSFVAAWRFTPLGEGACKAEYSMEYEFTTRVIASALEPVFRRIADSTVDAFTRRILALRGARHAG